MEGFDYTIAILLILILVLKLTLWWRCAREHFIFHCLPLAATIEMKSELTIQLSSVVLVN